MATAMMIPMATAMVMPTALNQEEWLDENLVRTTEGYIAYKTFGVYFSPPKDWKIRCDSEITSELNDDQHLECGEGINASTIEWQYSTLKINYSYKYHHIWEILIPYDADITVPFGTTGKFRCDKATLIKKTREGETIALSRDYY